MPTGLVKMPAFIRKVHATGVYWHIHARIIRRLLAYFGVSDRHCTCICKWRHTKNKGKINLNRVFPKYDSESFLNETTSNGQEAIQS